jgi:hypothetical protein
LPAGQPPHRAPGRWALLCLLCCAAASGCRKPEEAPSFRDVVVDHSDRAVELVAGLEVTQVVVPNHDHLSGLSVVLSNNGRKARDCTVSLRLRAKDSTADIALRTMACHQVPDEDWVRLDFPPLIATRGQGLVISVESPDARRGEAPAVMMSSVPRIYPDAKLRLGREVVPGALRFITYHR